jgi:hypothetical protein
MAQRSKDRYFIPELFISDASGSIFSVKNLHCGLPAFLQHIFNKKHFSAATLPQFPQRAVPEIDHRSFLRRVRVSLDGEIPAH